jgi:hypothetical protein
VSLLVGLSVSASALLGGLVPQGLPSLDGVATWYDWNRGEAAAGPALREYLGTGWRGTYVLVRAGNVEVTVRLTDWCLCSKGNRVIDLDQNSFASLAPLGRGVLPVSVSRVEKHAPRATMASCPHPELTGGFPPRPSLPKTCSLPSWTASPRGTAVRPT